MNIDIRIISRKPFLIIEKIFSIIFPDSSPSRQKLPWFSLNFPEKPWTWYGFPILPDFSEVQEPWIMESLLIPRDKLYLNKADFHFHFEITSAVIIWCFITSYDVHLSHLAHTIVVRSVFSIMLRFLYFVKNRMYEHLISF